MRKVLGLLAVLAIFFSLVGCEIIKEIQGDPREKDSVAPIAIRTSQYKEYNVGDSVTYDTILADVIGNPLYCQVYDNEFEYPNGIYVVFPSDDSFAPDSSKVGLQKVYFALYDDNKNIGKWDWIVIKFVGGDSSTPKHISIEDVSEPVQSIEIKEAN